MENFMKTQILLGHIVPHFRGGGALVLVILFGLIVVVGLIFAGSSRDKDR